MRELVLRQRKAIRHLCAKFSCRDSDQPSPGAVSRHAARLGRSEFPGHAANRGVRALLGAQLPGVPLGLSTFADRVGAPRRRLRSASAGVRAAHISAGIAARASHLTQRTSVLLLNETSPLEWRAWSWRCSGVYGASPLPAVAPR